MNVRTDQPQSAAEAVERGRHLPLTGAFNVRDTGGYVTRDGGTIRWGTLLRADSLHGLDTEAQERLIAYGVRSVVDLRSDREVEQWPNVLAGSERVRYVQLSLTGTPDDTSATPPAAIVYDLEVIYRRYLDERQRELAAVLTTLAEPDAMPALVHCMAGKDRTGLIIALLLGVAGVPHETIAEDYALTAIHLDDAYFAESRARAEASGFDWEQYQQLLVCPPEFMQRTLEYIDGRYGGIDAYVRAIGVSDAQIDALRAALVDGPAEPAAGAPLA